MMLRMKSPFRRRSVLEEYQKRLETLARISGDALSGERSSLRQIAVTAAWVGAGIGVLTAGLLAGRELRLRYKINRRTPYDYYAHSGEETPGLEFGVGI